MKPEKINRENKKNLKRINQCSLFLFLKKLELRRLFKNKERKHKIKLYIYFKIKAYLNILSY